MSYLLGIRRRKNSGSGKWLGVAPNALSKMVFIKEKTLQQDETGEFWGYGGAGSFGVFSPSDRQLFCDGGQSILWLSF